MQNNYIHRTALNIFLLILFLGFSSPAPLAAELHVIIKNKVNLRNGPGNEFPVLTQLNQGDIVIQTNQTDGWTYVQLLTGELGWVNKTLLDTNRWIPLLPDLALIKRGNLRIAPNTESDIITLLEIPGILKQIYYSSPWHAVISDDSTFGWIHDITVQEVPNSITELTVTTLSNIRSGPGTQFDIIGKSSPNDTYSPICRLSDWYLVKTDQHYNGWIHKDLVRIDLPGEEINLTIQIRSNGNVRSGPGLNYPVTAHVSPGMVLQIKHKNGDWFQLIPDDFANGWIHQVLIDTSINFQRSAAKKTYSQFESIEAAIDSAQKLRHAKKYAEAIQIFRATLPSLKQSFDNSPKDPCIRLYYALNLYVFAQFLYLEPGQDSEEAYRLLQSANLNDNCTEKIRATIHLMEDAVTVRSKVLSVFGNSELSYNELMSYTKNAPDIFPLITEAEIYRLIGRYLTMNKNDTKNAVIWQQCSVDIFQSLRDNQIKLGSLALENYFYALMELGISQVNLGIDASFDNFEKASKLIDENQNNYWRNYYKRTLDSIAN